MSITRRASLIRKLGTACHVEARALGLLREVAADRRFDNEVRDRADLHATETHAQLRWLSACLTTFGGPDGAWADVAAQPSERYPSLRAWRTLEHREIQMYQQLSECAPLAHDRRFLRDCLGALDVQRSVLQWLDRVSPEPARTLPLFAAGYA